MSNDTRWHIRVIDVLNSIDSIEQYTMGMTFESFKADRKTFDAVVRNVEIIGEAVNNIPDTVLEGYKNIPWGSIVGMRNVLAHEYAYIDRLLIWNTIQEHVPQLKVVVVAIRKDLPDESEDE